MESEAELKVPLLLVCLNLNLFSSNESPTRRIRKKEGEKEEGGGQEQTKGLVDTHTLECHWDFLLFQKAFQASHRPSRSL